MMPSAAWTDGSSPWTQGNVRILRAAMEALERDVIARYGAEEEACGYLAGPAEDGLLCNETVSLPNLANKLHAMDPEAFFRTARMFFAFNEKKFDDAVKRGRAEGRPVKVLYHSHLDTGAYFSATDAAVLSFGQPPEVEGGPSTLGPGPQWPLAFLVTSIVAGTEGPRVAEHRLFIWNGTEFVEAPFSVEG